MLSLFISPIPANEEPKLASLSGVYPLPEAQLDRFLFKLTVTDVDVPVLQEIISTRRRGEPPKPNWTMGPSQLNELFEAMDRIFLPGPVARYISRLTAASHPDSAEASEQVEYLSENREPVAATLVLVAAPLQTDTQDAGHTAEHRSGRRATGERGRGCTVTEEKAHRWCTHRRRATTRNKVRRQGLAR